MSFDQLGLSEKVLAAVNSSGYTIPTPIQEQAIPHILARRDVLGIAQTGTGKTAAFVLPMLTMLENGRTRARMPRTLILEPTRELAAQVEESFVRYGKNHKLDVGLLIGGVALGPQEIKLMRGVDVLIATPGRLLDLIDRGRLLMNDVGLLVIDEADRMLDMGFIPDIERICKTVPFTRQTLFFTATMPSEIKRVADAFLHNPVRVEASRPATTAVTVAQSLVAIDSDSDKHATLRRLIRSADNFKNAIIFCNRKTAVADLHRALLRDGFRAVALHGDLDQSARTAALDRFRQGDAPLLVASDVAARGLDIPDVSHVFNYDVPHHPEDYVHRVGRTGRAGKAGNAITIVGPHDRGSVHEIERLTGQKISWRGAEPAQTQPSSGSQDERRHQNEHRHHGGHGDGGEKRHRGGRGRHGGQDRPRHSDEGRPNVAKGNIPNSNSHRSREQMRNHPRDRTTERVEEAPGQPFGERGLGFLLAKPSQP